MKNYNFSKGFVIYAIVGAILGVAVSLSVATFIEYVGSIIKKPLLQEFSMVFVIFFTPILFVIGWILGITYVRKYKK